ncbi:hypothetical protein DFH09DRAFT_1108854 [Mycena vulgaris]|nr:hypothetical protein DFH09DRAFT_1108854 [Mycena vulgaris]
MYDFRTSPLDFHSIIFQGAEHFHGHIENYLGVFGVHYGDPKFLLHIPRPENAVSPEGYKFRKGDFSRPLWINPHHPYLLLLLRFNPFYGPLFSCLNVTKNNVPIEELEILNVLHQGMFEQQKRWGLAKSLIDQWLRLEGLLRLTLGHMLKLHKGGAGEGVRGFLGPINFRYTERNATLYSKAVDIALYSRDVFLPLMAQITLMFLLLNAHHPGDWRVLLRQKTQLHPQWMVDLELSAVGDFTIDRVGASST